jgi:hypothetical protein
LSGDLHTFSYCPDYLDGYLRCLSACVAAVFGVRLLDGGTVYPLQSLISNLLVLKKNTTTSINKVDLSE